MEIWDGAATVVYKTETVDLGPLPKDWTPWPNLLQCPARSTRMHLKCVQCPTATQTWWLGDEDFESRVCWLQYLDKRADAKVQALNKLEKAKRKS